MKTRRMVLVPAVLSVLLLLSVALPVSGQATRTDVSALESSCANGFEKMWMEGQVMHIRNFVHTNHIVSSNPLLNGINHTLASGNFNLLNGNGAINGTWSFQPDGIDGTWEGTWLSISNKGLGDRAWAVGQGKGALAGKTIFLEIQSDPSTENPCEDPATWVGNFHDEGYILDTGTP